jgi:Ni,Fe-hydrogenase III large subunit
MSRKYIEIENNSDAVKTADIPVMEYDSFVKVVDELFADDLNHVLIYFVFPDKNKYRFFCCVGSDSTKKILVFSHEQPAQKGLTLESISVRHFPFHIFEREISENYGIEFTGHPWQKPVRYPFNRADAGKTMNNYPFYNIESEELHEVGVGPIHAGIIEPGYFRFICNGENVLHLEIQLGYQHRGVEQLFVDKQDSLQRMMIAESIAGDTTIGHALCHAALTESLCSYTADSQLATERILALELERIAVHIGDTAALCTDIAYQFGQVVCEALRTIVINTTQLWCGNRFGKGLIRPFGTNYPMTDAVIDQIQKNIAEVESRYLQIADRIFTLPSVLARYEGIGKVSTKQVTMIGAVGMAARSSGLKRDIRWSHPFQYFKNMPYQPVMLSGGGVLSRALLRKKEIEKSVFIIREVLNVLAKKKTESKPKYNSPLQMSSFVISLTEGWRGEICHAALTNEKGEIVYYKMKDPSMHNWLALALAVRGQEISDFPLCNKSFNLSYCGNDL